MLRRFFRRAAPARIPEALWIELLTDPVFAHLAAPQREKLKTLSEAFLRGKRFYGAHGLELTDLMLATIAARATLLILELGLSAYRGWVGIVLYPGEFVIPGRDLDEDGIMHEYDEIAAGEAWDDGPVLLSWADVQAADAGYDVVLHEFAHKLDLLNGEADGVPRLHSGLRAAEWRAGLEAAFHDFCQRVEAAASRHPPCAAQRALEQLPLDAYAAEDPSEFFAVASETFFSAPQLLAQTYPAFYHLLTRFYRQNPLCGGGRCNPTTNP
ncbi:MAG: zinc-dependent peptidase [Zoogloeaceae bacterium]|jgi:Mlc titration factor MtfA (ptsG expression regulator)|nr:zinc-dependent peptidase [Zoogloeaceae bacterium]